MLLVVGSLAAVYKQHAAVRPVPSSPRRASTLVTTVADDVDAFSQGSASAGSENPSPPTTTRRIRLPSQSGGKSPLRTRATSSPVPSLSGRRRSTTTLPSTTQQQGGAASRDVASGDESAPVTTESPLLQLSDDEISQLKNDATVAAVFAALYKAAKHELPESTVPNLLVPVFHDGHELVAMLRSIDVPVRHFTFAWNSDDKEVGEVLTRLQRIGHGITVAHRPENAGFSAAVNAGLRAGEEMIPPATWTLACNADTSFPARSLSKFARKANAGQGRYGLVYGPAQDHFCFAITKKAVDTVGYFDEVFFPGYMEDIDYRWRVRLAGLPQLITGAPFHHLRSVNLNKPNSGPYLEMLHRASRGWEYGWMKWGRYGAGDVERDFPPSGYRTPFNIPGAPLHLWRVDPAQRQCVRTGKGLYHVASSTCWYNGTVLRDALPPGTKLPARLLRPGVSGDQS